MIESEPRHTQLALMLCALRYDTTYDIDSYITLIQELEELASSAADSKLFIENVKTILRLWRSGTEGATECMAQLFSLVERTGV